MARLQILELPEGSGDDRPPFVLVVDECAPQRYILGMDSTWQDHWQRVADKIGAQGVIVTPDTINIPANDLTLTHVQEAAESSEPCLTSRSGNSSTPSASPPTSTTETSSPTPSSS